MRREEAKLALVKLKSGMDRHPLRTKVLAFGILNFAGELLSQKKSKKKLQIRRLILASLYGFVYSGPADYVFRNVLDRISKGNNDWPTYFKKVFYENFMFYPSKNFVYMLYLGWVIEGKPWRSVLTDVKKDYPPHQLNDWKGRVKFYLVLGSCWFVSTKVKARLAAAKTV